MSYVFKLRCLQNCLLSHLGYSPFQLVYGRPRRLPCVVDDELPALETPGGSIPDHLKAREAFTAAESSDRIKRALKAQTRDFTRAYNTGDEVIFHRDGAWHGPGTVIGSESSVVFVRNASRVLKVHASKLRHRHTNTGVSTLADWKLNTTGNTSQEASLPANPIPVDDLEDSSTTDTGEPDVPNMSEVEAVTTSQVKLNPEVQPTPEPLSVLGTQNAAIE